MSIAPSDAPQRNFIRSQRPSKAGPTESQRYAIQGIKLLEEAIEKEFGLKILMGAELEFCVFPEHREQSSHTQNPLKVSRGAKYTHELPPYLEEFRSYIRAFYKEVSSNQYELVFNHETGRTSQVSLARTIIAMRKRIQDNATRYKVTANFNPLIDIDSRNLATNSLQINFSLIEGGNPIFDNEKNAYLVTEYIRNTIAKLQQETVLLHAPHNNSYDRLQKRFWSQINTGRVGVFPNSNITGTVTSRYDAPGKNGKYADAQFCRVENRLAGADADPFCVILVTLAGIYQALHEPGKLEKREGKWQFISGSAGRWQDTYAGHMGDLPLTQVSALKEFEQGHLLRDALNRLSDGRHLGDKFYDAIIAETKTRIAGKSVDDNQIRSL